MFVMKEILYGLYEGLKEYTNKEMPSYDLEIRKCSDTYCIIGDNLDAYQSHRLFHGGTTHNQFLLFVNIREPHIVSIRHWKNEVFPKEEILTFSHELMTRLLDQSDFKGVLQTDNRGDSFKGEYLMKRFVFGEHYQKLYSFVEPFIRPDTTMHLDGTFYVHMAPYIEQAEFKITAKGVVCSIQNQYYMTMETEEEAKQLRKTLREKIQNLIHLKKEIESLPTHHSLEWKTGNRIMVNGEKFVHQIRIVVNSRKMGYKTKVSPYGELLTPNTNGIMQLVQDKLKLMQ